MAAPYSFYYSVANDRTLNLPFPTNIAGAVAEITRRDVDDQDGLEPGIKTTVTMDYQFGFLRGTFQLEIEIIAVGNDGSLLVEAGDLTGSFVSQLIDLLPGDGETLVLTNTAGLSGSNLDELGVFDLEDPSIPPGQEFIYSENQSEGFVVGTVVASDNAEVSGFRILSGNDDGFFQINTDGQISLTAVGVAAAAASNDFETQPNAFNLEIEAIDAAGNTYSELVAVLLSDVDDEDPVLSQGQNFSYAESQSEGFVVGTVLATDNVAVTGYSIIAGNDDDFFAISANGEVSLTAAGAASASNDFETGPNIFSLTVEATDAAGNTGTEIVTISVTDIYEAKPIIGTNWCDFLLGSRAGETIEGLRGNDLIFGWNGDDVILGGSGCDFLIGGCGADDITGGSGRDTVMGGRGEDLFILTEGLGWDRILDFRAGEDKFGLKDELTFEDLSLSGNRILAGSDLLAVVCGFQTSSLSEDDFQIL